MYHGVGQVAALFHQNLVSEVDGDGLLGEVLSMNIDMTDLFHNLRPENLQWVGSYYSGNHGVEKRMASGDRRGEAASLTLFKA